MTLHRAARKEEKQEKKQKPEQQPELGEGGTGVSVAEF